MILVPSGSLRWAAVRAFISNGSPLVVALPDITIVDPNRWQPLQVEYLVSQNGVVLPSGVQQMVVHIGAERIDRDLRARECLRRLRSPPNHAVKPNAAQLTQRPDMGCRDAAVADQGQGEVLSDFKLVVRLLDGARSAGLGVRAGGSAEC